MVSRVYDLAAIREDFPVLSEIVYLDNAATTQTPRPVVEAMEEYFYEYAGNYGRGAHRLARDTTDRVEDAREILAAFIRGEPEHLVFTKNTTEAINLVAHGLDWRVGDQVVTTEIEHHSNLLPWLRLKQKGVVVEVVRSNREGIIRPEDVEAAISNRTRLVAVSHLSNVFGSVQDVEAICEVAHDRGALCLVDAAQSIGHVPFDVEDVGCDFLAIAGHKGLLGPQGTGALYMRDPDDLDPLLVGGGAISSASLDSYELEDSPARFEAGTPNIPGIIGLGRSVEYVLRLGADNVGRHTRRLAAITARGLDDLDGVRVYGPGSRAGVVSFSIEGVNPHDVALILDEAGGIAVRSGHHCAIPSVEMLGVSGLVRASYAAYNTEAEAEELVEWVGKIARELR